MSPACTHASNEQGASHHQNTQPTQKWSEGDIPFTGGEDDAVTMNALIVQLPYSLIEQNVACSHLSRTCMEHA